MQSIKIVPHANIVFLGITTLQALAIIDGLTTAVILRFPGGFESNPLYFPLLAVKTLALALAGFLTANRGFPLKITVAAFFLIGLFGFSWTLAIANNLGVIF